MNSINNTSRKIGNLLMKNGLKFIAQSFNLSPQKFLGQDITSFLKTKCKDSLIAMEDGNCYLIDLATWKEFIEFDWTKEKKYISDKFDCDNFSSVFASHASELFDISVSRVYGEVLDKNTKKLIGLHYWNALITIEKDSKHLYFYEPANSQMTEVIGQTSIIIENWIYRPIKIIVY